jgi:hypothetical protein
MNPCTLQFYLPLLVKDLPNRQREDPLNSPIIIETPQELRRRNEPWHELDSRFRKSLPDELYVKRLAYRGLLIRTCPKLKVLDGVTITEKEKRKSKVLLKSLERS